MAMDFLRSAEISEIRVTLTHCNLLVYSCIHISMGQIP